MTATKRRKVIKYAKGGDVAIERPSSLLSAWSDNEDNPLSPTFIPLTERGHRGKARWWALQGRRNKKPSSGVYDP